MRKQSLLLIFTFAFVFAYGLFYTVIARLKASPIKFHPLPLEIVEWTSKFQVKGAFVVDLDADGRGELLVEDKQGQLWWAKWDGKEPTFERVPFSPKEFIWTHDWRRLFQLIVATESNNLWLITRSGNSWEKVCIPIKDLPPPPISWFIGDRASLLDLDGDGKYNDVLVLRDMRKLEWWQRRENGRIELKDRLNLPRECERLDTIKGQWKGCVLKLTLIPLPPGSVSLLPPSALPSVPPPQHPPSFTRSYAFVSAEKGKLRWKGAFAENVAWIDADIDGDGRKERIERWKWRNGKIELFVQFANGELQVLTLPQQAYALIEDLDDNGQSEILVYDYTKNESVGVILWQFDREERKWHQKRKEFISARVHSFSPSSPYGSSIVLDKPKSSDWSLLITTKHGDRFQLERWRASESGWQSESVAVLPDPETEENWLVKKEDCLSVIWTGHGLMVVERRLHLRDLRIFFRRALIEIGLKFLEDHPLPSPPSRIWGWQPQKQRWLLLGYVLAYETGDLWQPTLLGSGRELAIIWLSSPDSVNVGAFRNSFWHVNKLTNSLDWQNTWRTLLWDGSQYWTILHDDRNFVAFTEPQPKAK